MSNLSYKDRCIIIRSASDEVDEYDNIRQYTVYNGECDFQPGGQTAGSIMVYNDKVYLDGVIEVRSNDEIEIRPYLGIGRKGVVSLVNFLMLDMTGDCLTEIEVKQSTEII